MEIDELRKRVAEERKRVEAANKKRDTKVVLSFIGVYLLIFFFLSDKPEEFGDYFTLFLSAIFTGGMHHAINSTVYKELLSKEHAEEQHLKKLQEELFEKEHEQLEKIIAESMKNIHQRR